jgi:UrcA family protein
MPVQTLRPNFCKRTAAAAAAMAFMLGAVGSAVADSHPSEKLPQVTVRYHDLDLSTAAGADRLLHRIEAGARQVCGDPAGTKDLAEWMSIRRCSSQAVTRAVEDVKAQRLTEAYRTSHSLARAN